VLLPLVYVAVSGTKWSLVRTSPIARAYVCQIVCDIYVETSTIMRPRTDLVSCTTENKDLKTLN